MESKARGGEIIEKSGVQIAHGIVTIHLKFKDDTRETLVFPLNRFISFHICTGGVGTTSGGKKAYATLKFQIDSETVFEYDFTDRKTAEMIDKVLRVAIATGSGIFTVKEHS